MTYRQKGFFLLIALAVVFVDFLSKRWIIGNLAVGGQEIVVWSDFLGVRFAIGHTTNTGAAWGMFSNYSGVLLAVRIGLISGIAVWAIRFAAEARQLIPVNLILGGAVSNVLDKLLYGHVVDMFHFIFWGYDYPVFNVADACICVGIGWFIIQSWGE